MMLAAAYGFKKGSPLKIITPFDSVGNRCGAPNQGVEILGSFGKKGSITQVNVTDFSEYKYKYFTNLKPQLNLKDSTTLFNAVCVKECPKKS